jgi:phospholipid/cholesterol/gamma-HCH transport system substrate-binding protein
VKGVSKEFKVGAIVITAIALMVIGVNYLKGIQLFNTHREFYATYDQIDGLAEANPVVMRGFKVGMVKKIELMEDGGGKLVVTFSIDNDNLKIPVNSKAKIFSSDFFGSKAIELMLGDSAVLAEPDTELLSEREEDIASAIRKELAPLKARTEELISGVDEIISNLNSVFSDKATQGLPRAFESLQNSLETFEKISVKLDTTIAESRSRLRSILDNVASLTGNIEESNEEITQVIQNFNAISDSLAKVNFAATILKAEQTISGLNEVIAKINSEEGSLGLLINNDTLHQSLVSATKELEVLLDDLNNNPDRYLHFSLFGKKEQERYSKREIEQLQKILKEEKK